MEEQLNNEKRSKYIMDRLNSTAIDPVYFPIIASIISRRSDTFNLSDEYFIRDVDTFVNNVKTIEVRKMPKGDMGGFYTKEEKIVISSEWFKKENLSIEEFLSAFAHECIHAMNFEKKEDGTKGDRTFSLAHNTGTMEAFTECEACALVYDSTINLFEDKTHRGFVTPGYQSITRYIDIVAYTFGVRKNELLEEAIKGPEHLQDFLNQHIVLRCPNSDKNKIFEGISRNIDLFYSSKHQCSMNPNASVENMVMANSKIYSFAEEGLENRLSTLVVEDIEVFKEEFTEIKINQKKIERTN